MFLAGSINNTVEKAKVKNSRHKKVNTLRSRVTPELSFELTWRFLEVIIDLSQYFSVEKILHHDQSGFSWIFKYNCLLSEAIMEKLTADAAEAFYPMPMTNAPVNWSWSKDGGIAGGYQTYQYEMIRASRTIDYSLYSQKIFDDVNYIQSVGWKVNEHLLNQVQLDLKVPIKGDYVKTQYPDPEPCQWDVDLKDESCSLSEDLRGQLTLIRSQFREQVELFNAEVGDYESAMGKYRAVRMATQIAQRYRGKTIYFPHSYDFRGRVYPIAVGLSPQGSDAVKSLLQYANGKKLNQRGQQWMWAYLASLYGDDKITFEKGAVVVLVDDQDKRADH